jgi:sulfate transport system permease protein
VALPQREKTAKSSRLQSEPLIVKFLLTTIALAFLALFLLVPVAVVFVEAFKKGTQVYLAAIKEPDALAAVKLTLLTAAIAVPLNVLFGLSAAWAIAKFKFKGKSLLITLIDFAVRGFAGDFGFDIRAAVRCAGSPGAVARRAQLESDFRRSRNCAGHDFCDVSVCGARADRVYAAQGNEEEEAAIVLARADGKLPAHYAAQHQSGVCCTESFCATPARWASSARFRSSPATSAE